MKKNTLRCLHKLTFMLLLSAFASAATATAPTATNNAMIVKDDSTTVIFSNWLNEMEGLCVYLNDDNKIEMSVNILLASSNLNTFPAIHYKYNFDNGTTGISPRVDQADLVPVAWMGQALFMATYIHLIDYPVACTDPNETVAIDYSLELVTTDAFGGYVSYPVADYIGTLFPDFTELSPGSSTAFDMGQKIVCCKKPPSIGGPEQRLAAGQNDLETSIQIAPNPFGNWIDLEATFVESAPVHIQIFDAAGKMWYQAVEQPVAQESFRQSIATDHFPPGIYFCKVNSKTLEAAQHIKLIKTQ